MIIFFSAGLLAQSTVDESKLKVFSPDEHSVVFNQIYTENFFFGNFGLKQLISAVPLNNKTVKTIKISATPAGEKSKPVMELNYDTDGKLSSMQILESFFGRSMRVDYQYKEGLIEKETITKKEKGKDVQDVNQFFYAEGKMIVLNYKQILDVYSLSGKVLLKRSYMDGSLVFNDRLDGKCRTTTYKGQPINKICFSSLNLDLPLTIDEYTNDEDKNGKLTLVKDQTIEIKKINETHYSVLNKDKEIYTLELDGNGRIKGFKFLGNKQEKLVPVDFKFNYTFY